jgi:hypothetical protein
MFHGKPDCCCWGALAEWAKGLWEDWEEWVGGRGVMIPRFDINGPSRHGLLPWMQEDVLSDSSEYERNQDESDLGLAHCLHNSGSEPCCTKIRVIRGHPAFVGHNSIFEAALSPL